MSSSTTSLRNSWAAQGAALPSLGRRRGQPKNLRPAPRRTAKEITDAQPDEAWQSIIWRESSSCPLSKQFHAGTGCARHSQTHGRSWAGPEGGSLANDRGLGRKEIPHGFSVAHPPSASTHPVPIII